MSFKDCNFGILKKLKNYRMNNVIIFFEYHAAEAEKGQLVLYIYIISTKAVAIAFS